MAWVTGAKLVGYPYRVCSKIRNVWSEMHQRCRNPNHPRWHRYGGRGITVDERWNDYATFRTWALGNGYRKGLQIDRRDNDGGYSPENCRWVTAAVNMANRSCSKKPEAVG